MKVLVVHPAQQHSYRLAVALYKSARLQKYVTTVYWKNGALTKLVSPFLPGKFRKKAMQRQCPDIPQNQVMQFCEGEGLLKLLAMNTRAFRPCYKKIKYHTADRFAEKVACYAIRHKVDAVVSFDDCSATLFDILAQRAPEILRIMDVSAANTLYMRQIYEKDMILQPEFADCLRRERTIVWNLENQKRAAREISLSQYFLAPSYFVARSLTYSGVKEAQIKICPYGVDTSQFRQKSYPTMEELRSRPIRFIYVGGAKELKGISYLLQAIQSLPPSLAQLTVVGNVERGRKEFQPYLDCVTFTGQVFHNEIPQLLAAADVFVFPSLGEGLSLSVLEAASCGLPLIVSENSGANDLMSGEQQGFVIPVQSVSALTDAMRWFVDHREQIEPMGRRAREMALQATWDRYYEYVNRAFDEIEEENKGKHGKNIKELSL